MFNFWVRIQGLCANKFFRILSGDGLLAQVVDERIEMFAEFVTALITLARGVHTCLKLKAVMPRFTPNDGTRISA